jgi:hypothetical protein
MRISKKFAKGWYIKKTMNTKPWLPYGEMGTAKNDRNGHKMEKAPKW